MAISNDDEARQAIAELLNIPVDKPGPTWLKVVDLCFYAKKRLNSPDNRANTKPKRHRTEYHRLYKRRKKAERLALLG